MTCHGDGAQSTSEYCALPFQHPPRCPGTAPGSTLNQRENNRQSHTKWISMRRRSVDQYGRTLTPLSGQLRRGALALPYQWLTSRYLSRTLRYLGRTLHYLRRALRYLGRVLSYLRLTLRYLALALPYLGLALCYLALSLAYLWLTLRYLALALPYLVLTLHYFAHVLPYLRLTLRYFALGLPGFAGRWHRDAIATAQNP